MLTMVANCSPLSPGLCNAAQGRRKIDNLVGGLHLYIRVLQHSFLLKLIAFTVCEHKYMNISPPPPQLSTFRRL